VNRQASAVILGLLGGAVLRVSLSDQYLRYVKQGLRPYLVAAGIALVAVAVMTFWYELRPRAAAPAHEHGDGAVHADDGHGHGGEPRIAWLLILPVLGLILVSPPALGSYAANRSGTALTATSDFAALPAHDPVRLNVLDYASRAVFEQGKSLIGRRVELTGFAMRAPDGSWYLARMVLSCCAADARPIKIGLTGSVPDGLAPDAWLRVVGRYDSKITVDDVNGERIPYVEVVEAKRIATPAEQYES
jgi:uncharacterized repeat protein (TIGR03943 family)